MVKMRLVFSALKEEYGFGRLQLLRLGLLCGELVIFLSVWWRLRAEWLEKGRLNG